MFHFDCFILCLYIGLLLDICVFTFGILGIGKICVFLFAYVKIIHYICVVDFNVNDEPYKSLLEVVNIGIRQLEIFNQMKLA